MIELLLDPKKRENSFHSTTSTQRLSYTEKNTFQNTTPPTREDKRRSPRNMLPSSYLVLWFNQSFTGRSISGIPQTPKFKPESKNLRIQRFPSDYQTQNYKKNPSKIQRSNPQSQSFSQSYGSILPNSLTYFILSTRGYSPRRPVAVISTINFILIILKFKFHGSLDIHQTIILCISIVFQQQDLNYFKKIEGFFRLYNSGNFSG